MKSARYNILHAKRHGGSCAFKHLSVPLVPIQLIIGPKKLQSSGYYVFALIIGYWINVSTNTWICVMTTDTCCTSATYYWLVESVIVYVDLGRQCMARCTSSTGCVFIKVAMHDGSCIERPPPMHSHDRARFGANYSSCRHQP
jgi:hypothetical protein